MRLSVTEIFSNHHWHLLTRNAIQLTTGSGTHLTFIFCFVSGLSCKEPQTLSYGVTELSSTPQTTPQSHWGSHWQGLQKCSTNPGMAQSIPAIKRYGVEQCQHHMGNKVIGTAGLLLESSHFSENPAAQERLHQAENFQEVASNVLFPLLVMV